MTGIPLSALGNHLWQSTLFAVLAALILWRLWQRFHPEAGQMVP